jgi:hypothetical protein
MQRGFREPFKNKKLPVENVDFLMQSTHTRFDKLREMLMEEKIIFSFIYSWLFR